MLSRYALVWCLLLYMGGIFALHAVGLFPRAGIYDVSRLQGATTVRLEGEVLDSPLLRWNQTRFLMQATAQPLDAFSGRVLVTLPWIEESLAPGDRVRARGWLTKPTERARDYWESRRVHAHFRVWYADSFEVVERSSTWDLKRLAWVFERRYQDFWERRLPRRSSALLLGVTVGARGLLPPELKEACIRAGVFHIVVVSGQNMSLIVNVGLMLLAAIAIPRRYALWICFIPILFYTTAVGADPPVVRAAVSAVVGLLVATLGRDIPSYYPLCLAALWILIRSPEVLLGASFQLSFAATLSILLVYPLWDERRTRMRAWLRWCLEPALMGFAVYIGIWPLLMAYFQRLSLGGLLANWTVFPLSGVLMVVGLVVGSIGIFAPEGIPSFLLWIVQKIAECMLWLIDLMSGWSWVWYTSRAPVPWMLALYYGTLFGILFLAHRRKIPFINYGKSRPRL